MACVQPLDCSSLLCVTSHLNSFQCSRSGSGIRPCADIPSLSIALAMWHYIVFIGRESIQKVTGTRVWSCPGKDLEFRVHLQCECVQLLLRPTLCDPMDYIACQAPLSMEFSRQECWSGLPFPFPGDLPDPGIEPASPTLQADSWMFELLGESKAVLFSKWEGETFILHVTWTPYGACFRSRETRAWLCLDSTNLAVGLIPIEH